MTPAELKDELAKIVNAEIYDPLLLLGPPGIGKTAIVRQVFAEHDMRVWDVRWGQLAPVDARGVPVPDHETKITNFYTPSFWPQEGPGCIFLDEFNMAPTAMMGLGQQLLLDRRFGDYHVPDGIHIWAAGNRKIDRAAVNEIPAPVNNRVAHYEVHADFESWETWAFATGIDARIVGFLKFSKDNLYKFPKDNPELRAWPSPRSWEMANRRLIAGMSCAPVIGDEVAALFESHCALLDQMPNLALIPVGRGAGVNFPRKPDLKWATISNLEIASMKNTDRLSNCLKWLVDKCVKEPEWVQMFVMDVLRIVGQNNKLQVDKYFKAMDSIPEVKRFISKRVV